MTTVEKNNAFEGTLKEVSFVKGIGALLSLANEYTIRLVLKIALLHADAADVSTTKLTMPAAAAIPTATKT